MKRKKCLQNQETLIFLHQNGIFALNGTIYPKVYGFYQTFNKV